MNHLFLILVCFSLSKNVYASDQDLTSATQKIQQEILVNGKTYLNLTELTKIGHRLAGSKNAEKAVQWGKQKMESMGLSRVWLQPVRIKRWERGKIARASVFI